MNEDVKNVNEEEKYREEAEKIVGEMKEAGCFDGAYAWIFVITMLLFGFGPLGKSDAPSIEKQMLEADKQQIAYLSGKIEAYEKMLRGE